MGDSGQVPQGDQGGEGSSIVSTASVAHTAPMSPAMVYLILAVIVLVMCLKVLRKIIVFVSESFILMLIIRHATGQHYHGEKRSDATMWQHGTTSHGRKFGHDGWMARWEHKPVGHRILWRWGCTLAFAGLVYGVFADRAVTVHAAEALMVYGAVVAGFVIETKWRMRVHNRHITNPTVKSLAAYLRISEHAVRRMLHISPENVTDEGEVGWFELLPELTPSLDQQSGIARIIDAHLPVDTEMEWQMQQSPKIGVIRAGLKPPPEVTWDEMTGDMELAAARGDNDIVIGRDRHKNVFTANFVKLEDPHWAFNVQTKRGKSNFLGLVAVQVLAQNKDAQVIAIDPKEESLIDFLGTPWSSPKPLLRNVTMANDPKDVQAMWDAVAKGKKLMDRRRADRARQRDKTYPICLVILDELNKFCHMTDAAWKAVLFENSQRPKEERENLPKEAPVYSDILDILHMGRFVGVHLIAVAQDFRASLLGGEARNGFGLRGLGGFIPSQWKMFIGTTPVPEAQNGVGRWIFWQGERQDWVQITHCDPDKAYAWAAQVSAQHDERAALGYVPDVIELTGGRDGDPLLSASILTTGSPVTVDKPVDSRRVIVGVREAARYLGYEKWRSFETARNRYPVPGEFRQGKSPAWYADDLDAWHRNRKGSN